MSFKKFLEMDSQGYTGRRDAPVELGGPETTVSPKALLTPKQAISRAHDTVAARENDYKLQDMIAKLEKISASGGSTNDQLNMIHQWCKTGHCETSQFRQMVAWWARQQDERMRNI